MLDALKATALLRRIFFKYLERDMIPP